MRNRRAPFAVGRRHRRAFTRVELLVVIAIIAVLSSLIGPAIQTTREAARRIQARSTLHKMGIVMRDFDDHAEGNPWRLMATNAPKKNADDTDERLFVGAVIALFATISAMTAALLIRFGVRFVNRRDKHAVESSHDEQLPSWMLDRWFCPPSSSPI